MAKIVDIVGSKVRIAYVRRFFIDRLSDKFGLLFICFLLAKYSLVQTNIELE